MTIKQIRREDKPILKTITVELTAEELWYINNAIDNEWLKIENKDDMKLRALKRDLYLYYSLTNDGAIDDITVEMLQFIVQGSEEKK